MYIVHCTLKNIKYGTSLYLRDVQCTLFLYIVHCILYNITLLCTPSNPSQRMILTTLKFKLQTKVLINLSSPNSKLFLNLHLSNEISSPLPYVLFHRLLFSKQNLKHSYFLFKTNYIHIKHARKLSPI